MKRDAKAASELVSVVSAFFKGQPEQVQGAALADLLAMWLAGHVAIGDPKATDAMREVMLEAHLVAVRALIPINHKIHVEPQIKERMQ